MVAYGVPMIGFIIGEPFLTQIDRVLLEVLRNSEAVGVYSSNYILVNQGLRLAYFPVLRAMQPIVVSEWNGDNENDVRDIISNFTRYYLLIGVPVMILGAALGRPLSTVLLDSGYQQGYTIIPLVAGGVFFWGLADAGQRGLELKEATLTMSIGVLLAIGLNILLNFPLIIEFGYQGAALATLLSSASYVVYVKLVSNRYIPWQMPRRTLRNSVLAGLAMAALPAAIYLFDLYTLPRAVAASAIAVPVYLTVMYTLNEFNESELRLVFDAYNTIRRIG
jgi:O-antigen/teichoic acid export membrane protein